MWSRTFQRKIKLDGVQGCIQVRRTSAICATCHISLISLSWTGLPDKCRTNGVQSLGKRVLAFVEFMERPNHVVRSPWSTEHRGLTLILAAPLPFLTLQESRSYPDSVAGWVPETRTHAATSKRRLQRGATTDLGSSSSPARGRRYDRSRLSNATIGSGNLGRNGARHRPAILLSRRYIDLGFSSSPARGRRYIGFGPRHFHGLHTTGHVPAWATEQPSYLGQDACHLA